MKDHPDGTVLVSDPRATAVALKGREEEQDDGARPTAAVHGPVEGEGAA